MRGNSGSISTPNWPSIYDSGIDCEWIVVANKGERVQVRFTDISIEPSPTCSYDYVVVFDGFSQTELAKLCGKKKNVTLTGTGNEIRIRFLSDVSTNDKGFLAHWSVQESTDTPIVVTTGKFFSGILLFSCNEKSIEWYNLTFSNIDKFSLCRLFYDSTLAMRF